MLVFIIIGLSLIFMAVYTYYYVSVNTSAIILIALLVYFPYFLIKTMGNVDFKSQIANLTARKRSFRRFLKKSNFYGLMNNLYETAPKLLKVGEDYEDTSFTILKDDLTVRFYKDSNGDIKVSLKAHISGVDLYEIFASELFWLPDCRNITVLNMVVLSINSIIGDELPKELENAKTRNYSMLYDKNLLSYGSKAYLKETVEDGFGSMVMDFGYDLTCPFTYTVDLQNREVTLYQEKLGTILPVLRFNGDKWRELRENQIISIKET